MDQHGGEFVIPSTFFREALNLALEAVKARKRNPVVGQRQRANRSRTRKARSRRKMSART
jgi:hypothetical protein